MDFSVHHTEDQERFRAEVRAWLDARLPGEREALGGGRAADGAWDDRSAFQRQLGEKGWLVPAGPIEWGGGGLTPERATVLREELRTRGLLGLVDGGPAPLARAVQQWGTEEQKRRLLPLLCGGNVSVWRLALEPGAQLDALDLGVRLSRDGDDYILDGADLFTGQGTWPDYLWTLARIESSESPRRTAAAFLVPSGLDRIRIQSSRLLIAGEAHRVSFEHVAVPPLCLLGEEGEGWPVLQDGLQPELLPEYPPAPAPEVTDLLQYARETGVDGRPLGKEPYLQQQLVEAYLDGFVTGVLRARNAWMAAAGQQLTYHTAQLAWLGKRAALRLAATAREVMGPYTLLDEHDPWAPFRGRFERHQRRSLAQQNPTGGPDAQLLEMAKHLGLGQRQEESPTPVSPGPPAVDVEDWTYNPALLG